tara:strand:- start:11446 stop:11856 length:411 start_codon:yes stop_codon:yes gene_type:complete
MSQFISKPLLVRYGETDQMGIVHHSNYLRYFEVARLEWLTNLGLSYALMEKEGIVMPVIDVKLTYNTPAFFEDMLTIHIFLNEVPKVKIIFLYKIKNQKNDLVCSGETTLAFLNAKSRKPIRCPEKFKMLFSFENK